MLKIERDFETGDMKIPVLLFKMLKQEFVFLKERKSGILYFSDTKHVSYDLSSKNEFQAIENDDLKLIAKKIFCVGELESLKIVIESEMVSMLVDENAMPNNWEIMRFKSELSAKYKELE